MALFLSVVIITGDAFMYNDSLELATEGRVRLMVSVIRLIGYVPLFTAMLRALFVWMCGHMKKMQPADRTYGTGLIDRYMKALIKHPVPVAFITMWILYLPIIITCYPALMMGDVRVQLAQAYNMPDYHPYVHLISEDVKLFNHHPILHTLFLGWCVRTGVALTGSWNVGAFIYCMLQITMSFLIYSIVLGMFTGEGITPGRLIWIMVYLLFCPALAHSLMVISKDYMYSSIFLLFVACLWRLLKVRAKAGRGLRCAFILSVLGMMALRKEGVYVLILTFLVIILTGTLDRWRMGMLIVAMLCIHLLWGNIILPAFRITPGSRREALSMPLQMTARYVVQYGDEVTEDEREAIDGIVEYDKLAENYDPIRARVKNLHREDSTNRDLVRYAGAFCRMFLKHPSVYIIAAANFKYKLFYPTPIDEAAYDIPHSVMHMEKINEQLHIEGAGFHHPDSLEGLRRVELDIWYTLKGLPVLRFMFSSSTYVWGILILLAYAIIRRNRYMLCLITPPVLTILVLMAGPCGGGYNRYIIPLAVSLPMLIIMFALDFDTRKA